MEEVATDPVRIAVTEAVAVERFRVVATLVRVTGDWELAEDSFQDAAERALERWPSDGVPDNPAAWLTTTARRRALDVVRRRRTERDKLRQVWSLAQTEGAPVGVEDGGGAVEGPYADDRIRMLFACCHPALPMAGRVALTLKSVTGLSTRQVARALLVSEQTMGQRLLRTRAKIRNTGISFAIPAPERLADRTAAVLAVVYLLFTEGYAAPEGEPRQPDVAAEAVQLAELLTRLLPEAEEVHGLHALVLFQHSRRDTRLDAAGDLLTMEEQDRTRWDRAAIGAGLDSLAAARAIATAAGRRPGYYLLQAEIAALHATAADAAATDWRRIVTAYDALRALRPSPVVALNRAVAVGFADGPEAGLREVAGVARDLGGYPLLPAVTADLLRRAGRGVEAAGAYRAAIGVAATDAERGFLRRRLDEVTGVRRRRGERPSPPPVTSLRSGDQSQPSYGQQAVADPASATWVRVARKM